MLTLRLLETIAHGQSGMKEQLLFYKVWALMIVVRHVHVG